MKILAFSLIVALSSVAAMATEITCKEKDVKKDGKLTIKLDRSKNLVDYTDHSGESEGDFDTPTPVKNKKSKSGDSLIFHFTTQDRGDGDYPGPKNYVVLTIPASLEGDGHVHISFSNDDAPVDHSLDCGK